MEVSNHADRTVRSELTDKSLLLKVQAGLCYITAKLGLSHKTSDSKQQFESFSQIRVRSEDKNRIASSNRNIAAR